MKVLDRSGLERLWLHIIGKLGEKVDRVEGKGLSTNDYTTEEKEKLVLLNGLVGNTAVSTQINNAVSSITTESIGALSEEDYYGIVREEDSLVSVKSLDGLAIKAITNIEAMQSGTEEPSSDNIRPITGWNTVNLSHTGKNMTNLGTVEFVRYKEITLENPIPSGDYVVSATINTTDTDDNFVNFYFICADGSRINWYISPGRRNHKELKLTSPLVKLQMYAAGNYPNGTGDTVTYADIQIEAGTVATDYEPCQGAFLSAELPETVYGGTLNWNAGILTITHRHITLTGDEDWASNQSVGQFFCEGMLTNNESTASINGGYCSHYKYGDTQAGADKSIQGNGSYVWITDSSFTTVDELKTYLAAQVTANTPVELVYPLAAPYTVQLMPQQLTSIDGINHVWSNCGSTQASFNYSPSDNIVVDTELSETSTNPVQNAAISVVINNLKNLVGDTTVPTQISNAIADLINGAPTTLDTLGEIATAMEENADVVAALDSAIGSKANISDLSSHINDETNPHNVTLDQLNVSATATELNFVSGIRSNIQAQFDELSVSITNDEIDAICGSTLELDSTLTDELTGTTYTLYVSEGKLKMTEVNE